MSGLTQKVKSLLREVKDGGIVCGFRIEISNHMYKSVLILYPTKKIIKISSDYAEHVEKETFVGTLDYAFNFYKSRPRVLPITIMEREQGLLMVKSL